MFKVSADVRCVMTAQQSVFRLIGQPRRLRGAYCTVYRRATAATSIVPPVSLLCSESGSQLDDNCVCSCGECEGIIWELA